MKTPPSYLTCNRHGTYYFRMVIPGPVRPLLNGQREVRRTLYTDSRRLALKRARQHAARFERAFDIVMRAMKETQSVLTEAELDELMDIFYPTQTALPDFSSPTDGDKTDTEILSNEELEARQRRSEVARLLTGAHDRDIPERLQPIASQLLEMSSAYQPTELRRALPKLRDALAMNQRPPGAVQAAQAAPACVPPEHAHWTLYEVWKHQLERDKADAGSRGGQAKHGGTLEERERLARVMTVLTRHKPVLELTKPDWQAAYDAARRMKVGAKASIAPPTPLEDFLTDDPAEMTGHERVSALISSMKQIQEHARFLDLTQVRADDLIIKKVPKRVTKRSRKNVPFSAADVEAIFSGYIYQGPLPDNRTKAYPFWFWLPLVAYFTGARTNEIAQLDTADVREVDGYPCFDICPDVPGTFEAKRVKTEEARQIPIHPRLIELGLLDYAEEQRRTGQKKLFGDGLSYLPPRSDDLDHNKEGWAKAAGKFFNESPKGYLVSIGVHKPHDGKSLYSFRHTLETNLRNARRDGRRNAEQGVIDSITGHTTDTAANIDSTVRDAIAGRVQTDMGGMHYDGGPTIQHKLDALMLLPIPDAVSTLTSYKVNFVERFGATLERSIRSHRIRQEQQRRR